MKIEVKQNLSEYTIRQMARTMTGGGDYQLSWNFNRATHFLVVVHQAKTGCDLEGDVTLWLSENGERLLENRKIMADDILWNVVTEREFIAKKNKFVLPRKDIIAGIPYRIIVWPCRIDEEQWEIYEVLNQANVEVIPVSVLVEVIYKKSWFSKEKLCLFRPRFDINRLEGVLRYKPSCSRCLFPISVKSMREAKDGWLSVWLPKNEELNVTVAPEYKDYYNIKIADD